MDLSEFMEVFDIVFDWQDVMVPCPTCEAIGHVEGSHPLLDGVTCTWCDGGKVIDLDTLNEWVNESHRPAPQGLVSYVYLYPRRHSWLSSMHKTEDIEDPINFRPPAFMRRDSDLLTRVYGS